MSVVITTKVAECQCSGKVEVKNIDAEMIEEINPHSGMQVRLTASEGGLSCKIFPLVGESIHSAAKRIPGVWSVKMMAYRHEVPKQPEDRKTFRGYVMPSAIRAVHLGPNDSAVVLYKSGGFRFISEPPPEIKEVEIDPPLTEKEKKLSDWVAGLLCKEPVHK